MIEHAGVHIAHGVAAAADDEALEKVNDFCWVEHSILSDVAIDYSQTSEGISHDNGHHCPHHSQR